MDWVPLDYLKQSWTINHQHFESTASTAVIPHLVTSVRRWVSMMFHIAEYATSLGRMRRLSSTWKKDEKKHPISWWVTKVESDILQHPATSSPDLLAFPAHGLLALQAVHKGLNPCIQALASLCSCQHILTERSLHPNKLTCRQLLKACHTLLAANLLKFFPLQDWPNAAITCN